jgi:hypothetical protein
MGIEWLAAASLRMTVAVGIYGGVLVFEAFEQNVIELFTDFWMLLARGAASLTPMRYQARVTSPAVRRNCSIIALT